MKYFFINSVYGVRSTGKLISAKCRELSDGGDKCYVAYGREAVDDGNAELIKIGNSADSFIHAAGSMLFDRQGLFSRRCTNELIKKIEKISPDVIWLHNIHGYYINYPIFFRWLKTKKNIKKYWTLHDCWAFTGHCAYFTMAKCDKWQSQCFDCPQLKTYPKSLLTDNSKNNYLVKKEFFSNIDNLTIITPSHWLMETVEKSFLRGYPIEVCNNTVDEAVFKPVESDYRKKNSLENKFIVLGVAVAWEETKGLQDMIRLRSLLDDNFVMVLIGVTDKQVKGFPPGIIGMQKTSSQQELVEIYSAADVLVNPTHQDNFPTVNLEARACGTPVVTYNVGGSPESAGYEYIAEENDLEAVRDYIYEICKYNPSKEGDD